MMGTGVAEGEHRAVDAARRAISSPLLEGTSVNGARGVIINITGGPDLSLSEVNDASTIIQEAADQDANIIFGAVVDPTLKGKTKITVIATGFGALGATLPASSAQTPVDMTPYADTGRARLEQPVASGVERVASSRLSIARRPPVELPSLGTRQLAAAAIAATAAGAGGAPLEVGEHQALADAVPDEGSTFDVPAFLRRHDG
jgi:cell division protein FtsZ